MGYILGESVSVSELTLCRYANDGPSETALMSQLGIRFERGSLLADVPATPLPVPPPHTGTSKVGMIMICMRTCHVFSLYFGSRTDAVSCR